MICPRRHRPGAWREAAAARCRRRDQRGQTRPILVVEDDPALRELLAEGLRVVGYRVLTARNGAVALDQARRRPPRLILLDLRMPVLDGWAFARAYRALPGARAPIIVVTGTATPPAGPEWEGVVVLDKPFHLADLRALVAAHLPSA